MPSAPVPQPARPAKQQQAARRQGRRRLLPPAESAQPGSAARQQAAACAAMQRHLARPQPAPAAAGPPAARRPLHPHQLVPAAAVAAGTPSKAPARPSSQCAERWLPRAAATSTTAASHTARWVLWFARCSGAQPLLELMLGVLSASPLVGLLAFQGSCTSSLSVLQRSHLPYNCPASASDSHAHLLPLPLHAELRQREEDFAAERAALCCCHQHSCLLELHVRPHPAFSRRRSCGSGRRSSQPSERPASSSARRTRRQLSVRRHSVP